MDPLLVALDLYAEPGKAVEKNDRRNLYEYVNE
jgi:hypothetical protein